MVEIGFDTSNLAVLFSDGAVCIGCCCDKISDYYSSHRFIVFLDNTGFHHDGEHMELWWNQTRGCWANGTNTVELWVYWNYPNPDEARIIVHGSYGGQPIFFNVKAVQECLPQVFRDADTPSQQWNYTTGGRYAHYSPVIMSNGNVVFCGYRQTKSVWCVDSGGSLVWDYDTGASTFKLAVDSNGNTIVTGERSGDKTVWSIDSSGNLNWSYDTLDKPYDIAIDSNDNVIIVGGRVSPNYQTIWSIDSSGNPNWSIDTGMPNKCVAIDSNNNVIAGGIRSTASVWSFDSIGGMNWSYDTGNTVGAVAIDPNDNGKIVVGGVLSNLKTVWALDGSGNLRWDYRAGEIVLHTSSIPYDKYSFDNNGNVYISGYAYNDKNIWKLDASGSLVWSIAEGETDEETRAVRVVGNSLFVVPELRYGGIQCYDLDGVLKWSTYRGSVVYGFAVGNGFLYGTAPLHTSPDYGNLTKWLIGKVVVDYLPLVYWNYNTDYAKHDIYMRTGHVIKTDYYYRCIKAHNSGSTTEKRPWLGDTGWEEYWERVSTG